MEAPLRADALLRQRADTRPQALALADPPNRESFGLAPPRSFTYAEVNGAVDTLAQFFIEIGLEPDDTILVQLPNMAEQPLVILAAWRAGLTVAMVPMLWRGFEIASVCDQVAPKALIGVSRFGAERPWATASLQPLCQSQARPFRSKDCTAFSRTAALRPTSSPTGCSS
ncbi:MAG: AMP-binding protein [Methyloceanibacter sp.]|uniref:AMP-binding protein n=1 Tax=Methyloceanibacter sp. TaxID=1965321 RepID=UPI003D9BAE51